MKQPQDRVYSSEERLALLEVARHAMVAALSGRMLGDVGAGNLPCFQERRGCFVTLRSKAGQLRGCIGTFDRTEPLLKALVSMTRAATRDSRFADNPVTLEEVELLRISVRVLTPLEPLPDPLLIEIGTEGIYIIAKRGSKSIRGCFLPEVATEQGWNPEQFVSHCCTDKMNLPPGVWKPPTDLEFFKFRAIGVSE